MVPPISFSSLISLPSRNATEYKVSDNIIHNCYTRAIMSPLPSKSLCFVLLASTILPTSQFAPAGSPFHQQHLTDGSQLQLSRDNDRARMEKSWENMMGDDWREFRARLVAMEHAEAREEAKMKQTASQISSNGASSGSPKEEKFGKLFAGAISSIFSKGSREDEGEKKNIFNGDAVGGATKFSKIDVPTTCEDPFLSVEECHIMYDKSDVTIDKHRWAHPLFHLERGCILVANEKLGGVFHQTVVLIIDHNEATGSTGMVINRPFKKNLIEIVSGTDSNIDLSLKMAFGSANVAYGGPVMQDQFSTLHGFGEVEGSKKICAGVYVGGSSQLMQEVRRKTMVPTDVLFIKGHAAWVPGQLTREIEKGVWYVAAASTDFILRYAGAPLSEDDNPSDLWADILSCMGDKYETIATTHSGKGDDRMMP